MNPIAQQPGDFYAARIRELTSEIDLVQDSAKAALVWSILLVVAGLLIFYGGVLRKNAPEWPALALLPVIVALGRRAKQKRHRAMYLSDVRDSYEKGVARLQRNWKELDKGNEFFDAAHDYAADLDLFGEGSMFQLLCSARTQAGRQTLAKWMKEPASAVEARARRDAIRELASQTDIREALAGIRSKVPAQMRSVTFLQWVSEPMRPFHTWMRVVGAALAASLITLLVIYGIGALSLNHFWNGVAIVLALELVYAGMLRPPVKSLEESLGAPLVELPVVRELLDVCNREKFSSARLLAIQARLGGDGRGSARAKLLRLYVLMRTFKLRDDPWLTVFCYALAWGTQFALAIEQWRSRFGAELLEWLNALGEFEALLSLSGYAFEHPGDTFPELLESGLEFDARSIGHPLIADRTCVRNDVRLSSDLRFLIVSGSNMSGKSTFLRAIGTNAMLAWMGAPVRCASLRISRLAIVGAIRIQDSVTEGRSAFFAAMQRLRRMVDLAAEKPVLFLSDEMMAGTNSHDRRIAAEWVVRALMERTAVGAISTHDLALAEIAKDGMPGRLVCFEDVGEGGELRFDYKLREGLPTRSNALNIARMLGLSLE